MQRYCVAARPACGTHSAPFKKMKGASRTDSHSAQTKRAPTGDIPMPARNHTHASQILAGKAERARAMGYWVYPVFSSSARSQ